MKIYYALLNLTILAVCTAGCMDGPTYPDAPVIAYLGVNKPQIYQDTSIGLPNDTLRISFSFTDGDGDLSNPDSVDIFMTDSRIPDVIAAQYKVPAIPEAGTGNGIRGEITVNIVNQNRNICCIEQGDLPCDPTPEILLDSFSYTIQIRDRAGNFSNRIQTETIDILCQ